MNRRAKIRLVSFLTALVVALTAWGTTASVTAARYKRTAEISNQRALMRLCEYLDNIETDLTKASYVNSGVMLATLSGDLHKQATGAKTSLSALSSGETQLSNTYKFLSQVGEYTASLNKKAAGRRAAFRFAVSRGTSSSDLSSSESLERMLSENGPS